MNTEFGSFFNILIIAVFFFILQFLICPMLQYEVFEDYLNEGTKMSVSQLPYMQNVLPLILAFVIGIEFGRAKLGYEMPVFSIDEQAQNYRIGIELLIISYVAKYVLLIDSSGLNFLLALLRLLNLVGLLYLYFSAGDFKRIYLFGGFLEFILFSLNDSFFANLIIFLPIFYNFISSKIRSRPIINYLVVILSFVALIFFQGSKGDYREKLNEKTALDHTSSFELFLANIQKFDFASTHDIMMKNIGFVNYRLNQGWVQSGIIQNKGSNSIPFLFGKDLLSIILPRFLFETKATVISMKKFALFTGITISDSTVFGVSFIGDIYANFSFLQSVFLIFLIVFLIVKLFNYLYRYSLNHKRFIFWIPLFFFHFVRPGDDFLMSFNWIIKGLVFVLILNLVVKRRYF
jgi:hypothetical protein